MRMHPMSKVTIYHNPRCSKSRQTLALLENAGIEPKVVEYLQTPPDARSLARIVKQLGIEPRELIRRKEYRALDLPETDDAQELIARMAAHPEIIERPIVVAGGKARLGRPPESVLEIL
jgi:arsenate reductase